MTAVGDVLPPISTHAITRLHIAYMAVAMHDPNPVHVDDEFAREAGMPSAIAHGTFAVSYLGAAISRTVGVDQLRRLRVELTAPIFPGEHLVTSVVVDAIDEIDGTPTAHATLSAVKPDGTIAARGEATWTIS